MHQEHAAIFTSSHSKRLHTQFSFLLKAWTLHSSPSGERQPKGQPSHRFSDFSHMLKQLFEVHPLPPYATVDPDGFEDKDHYYAAVKEMRLKANRQWSKWEKMSNWGEDAIERLIQMTEGNTNE